MLRVYGLRRRTLYKHGRGAVLLCSASDEDGVLRSEQRLRCSPRDALRQACVELPRRKLHRLRCILLHGAATLARRILRTLHKHTVATLPCHTHACYTHHSPLQPLYNRREAVE